MCFISNKQNIYIFNIKYFLMDAKTIYALLISDTSILNRNNTLRMIYLILKSKTLFGNNVFFFRCSFVRSFLCSFVRLFVSLFVCMSVCLFVRCLRSIQEFFTTCFYALGLLQLGIEHPSFCICGALFNRMRNRCHCDPGNASRVWSDWS